MSETILVCPRCHSVKFERLDCGPDTYENDISYTSDICQICGLYHSGWDNRWLLNVSSWQDEETATEYIP